MEGKTTQVEICRPGCEDLLAEELRRSGAPLQVPAAPAGAPLQGSGWLAWQPEAHARPGALPGPRELVFERQRLPDAVWLPGTELAALAEALWPHWRAALQAGSGGSSRTAPVTLHVFAPDPTGEHSQSARAARLERRLRDGWARALGDGGATPAPDTRAAPGGRVWQVCLLAEGAWSSLAPAAGLADPCPGGVHRMLRAQAAPSRSVLKIEEALEVLGRAPQARDRAIDLGAAPGGWSYAFLQRGCRVLAVDNGALKLPGLDDLPGELTHLRTDGLRVQPPPGWVPADWLLSDMLIAPGVCLGLLRKWIEAGWMRRFIVNVKLPQRDPLVALGPLRAYLAQVPHLDWRMRQLYHDRREVTVLGEFTAPRPVRAPAGEAPRRAATTPLRGRRKPAAHPPRAGAPGPARAPARRRGGHTRPGRRS